MGSTQPPVK